MLKNYGIWQIFQFNSNPLFLFNHSEDFVSPAIAVQTEEGSGEVTAMRLLNTIDTLLSVIMEIITTNSSASCCQHFQPKYYEKYYEIVNTLKFNLSDKYFKMFLVCDLTSKTVSKTCGKF